MKKLIHGSMVALLLLALNSCYVNRTTVGDGPVGKDNTAKYSRAKQLYFFWGIVRAGNPEPRTPSTCGYQVKTSFNAWDALISALTAGIVSTRSIKVLVNKNGMCGDNPERTDTGNERK